MNAQTITTTINATKNKTLWHAFGIAPNWLIEADASLNALADVIESSHRLLNAMWQRRGAAIAARGVFADHQKLEDEYTQLSSLIGQLETQFRVWDSYYVDALQAGATQVETIDLAAMFDALNS